MLDVPRSSIAAVAAGAYMRRGTLEVVDRQMRAIPEAAAHLAAVTEASR